MEDRDGLAYWRREVERAFRPKSLIGLMRSATAGFHESSKQLQVGSFVVLLGRPG